MIHPGFCRNWQLYRRWEADGARARCFPPDIQSSSLVAPWYFACLCAVPTCLSQEAVHGAGTIMWKMFDEVRESFSCVSVTLTNYVHHLRRKQSLWGGCGMREDRKEACLPARRLLAQFYRKNLQGSQRNLWWRHAKAAALCKLKVSWRCLKDEHLGLPVDLLLVGRREFWKASEAATLRRNVCVFARGGASASLHLSHQAATALFQSELEGQRTPGFTSSASNRSSFFSFLSDTEMYFLPVL